MDVHGFQPIVNSTEYEGRITVRNRVIMKKIGAKLTLFCKEIQEFRNMCNISL